MLLDFKQNKDRTGANKDKTRNKTQVLSMHFDARAYLKTTALTIAGFHVTSPKVKITNPSKVLVSSDVRVSNDLTFYNVSARQGFSFC